MLIEWLATSDMVSPLAPGLLSSSRSGRLDGDIPDAHGSGFDRVSAFQDGYERGVAECARYEDDPPPVVAIPFGSFADRRSGGNLPIGQLIEPLVADLESERMNCVRCA